MADAQTPARYEVHLVALDPTQGSEIAKTRPCVIVSPDDINRYLRTVVVVPLTGRTRSYRFRPDTNFGGTHGQAAIDQIRSVDKSRLRRRLGVLSEAEIGRLSAVLNAFFADPTRSN